MEQGCAVCCDVCKNSFKTIHGLREHEQIDTKSGKYKCCNCNQIRSLSNRATHLRCCTQLLHSKVTYSMDIDSENNDKFVACSENSDSECELNEDENNTSESENSESEYNFLNNDLFSNDIDEDDTTLHNQILDN